MDIKKVVTLAELIISEEDQEKYQQQLSKILDYMAKLSEVDTSMVESTFNVSLSTNTKPKIELDTKITQKQAIANIDKSKDGYFVSKGVFNDD